MKTNSTEMQFQSFYVVTFLKERMNIIMRPFSHTIQ